MFSGSVCPIIMLLVLLDLGAYKDPLGSISIQYSMWN